MRNLNLILVFVVLFTGCEYMPKTNQNIIKSVKDSECVLPGLPNSELSKIIAGSTGKEEWETFRSKTNDGSIVNVVNNEVTTSDGDVYLIQYAININTGHVSFHTVSLNGEPISIIQFTANISFLMLGVSGIF